MSRGQEVRGSRDRGDDRYERRDTGRDRGDDRYEDRRDTGRERMSDRDDDRRDSGRDRDDDRRDSGREERQRVRKPGSRHGYPRKDYGTWRPGDHIPGKITKDDKPDMRDLINREEFLGETTADRSRRIGRNLLGGGSRSQRDYDDQDRGQGRSQRRDTRPARDQDQGRSQRRDARGGSIDEAMSMLRESVRDADDRDLPEIARQLNDMQDQILKEMTRREPPRRREERDNRGNRRDDNDQGRSESRGRDRDRDRGSRRDDNVPRNERGRDFDDPDQEAVDEAEANYARESDRDYDRRDRGRD